MKIVVSGSAGLVGSNIVCTLLNNGDAVTAMVHRDRRTLEGLDVTIAAGDIEDVDSLRVSLLVPMQWFTQPGMYPFARTRGISCSG
ncbi:MAG: NAD-dependent epimerase/dehydratase family protein [bacterium]